MRLLGVLAAAALAAALASASSDAVAQRNRGGSGVVFINFERVINESLLGRDMGTKLQQIQAQVAQEGQALAPEQESLEQEAQRLQRARGNLSDEQVRNSSTLAPQFQQFAQRRRQLEVRAATLRGDFECSQAAAARDFRSQVMPVVQSIMAARGASAVMDSAAAIYSNPDSDITTAVIQQLDQNPNTRVANVTRRPVAECLPQQTQQPAPAPAQ
jgi:Skp family chaperone for outer membrane proteins